VSSAAEIGTMRASERDAVFALLAQHHLPLDGLDAHGRTTYVVRQNGRLVACAALEVYADGALLRSVAVDGQQRGRGLGQVVVRAAIAAAEALELPSLYLLTTTAVGFFPKFGFERITRAGVPSSVQQSVEFTSACPASAIVMRKSLRSA